MTSVKDWLEDEERKRQQALAVPDNLTSLLTTFEMTVRESVHSHNPVLDKRLVDQARQNLLIAIAQALNPPAPEPPICVGCHEPIEVTAIGTVEGGWYHPSCYRVAGSPNG